MTCIVGLVDGSDVVIGGDSAAIGMNHSVTVRREPKVFRNGPAVIGFCDSFRMGQLLRFVLTVPPMREEGEVLDWIVCDVVPRIRDSFKDGGFAEVADNVERGGAFLFAAYGRLFQIEDDFHVGEAVNGFDAIGCGAEFALGALRATEGITMPAEERVLRALRAAEHLSGGVREPFTVLRLLEDRSSRGARKRTA